MDKIRQIFNSKGYNPNSMIKKEDYHQLLNTLINGVFDYEVANELWNQASDGREGVNEIRVDNIASTIVDGQNILQNKLEEINDEINSLQSQKRQLQSYGGARNTSAIAKLESDIQNLKQDKDQYQQDLRLLTETFGISLTSLFLSRRSRPSPDNLRQSNLYTTNQVPNKNLFAQLPQNENDNKQLKWVLFLTLGLCFLQIIMIYGKYDFLNLIVITCLLSIYLLNFFDQTYIKLTLGLLIVSVILDIVWLILYSSSKWNPPKISNDSRYQITYMRFIVFFTIVAMLVKLPLGWFLFQYRNTSPDNKYALSLGIAKIVLTANKSNPISKGINNNFSS